MLSSLSSAFFRDAQTPRCSDERLDGCSLGSRNAGSARGE